MHTPVLLQEAIEILNPQPGQNFIDATVNGGGHSAAILEKISPGGSLIGIDWDCDLIEAAKFQISKSKFQKTKIILECDNYAHIKSIARKYNLDKVSGILFDLGFSSHHIEDSLRGFSFRKNEPLDMRYNTKTYELTAKKIINNWSQEAIEDILRNYGEERYARRIVQGIVRARERKEISTTNELLEVIAKSVPGYYLRSRLHYATRTFQALRIAVNKELENLSLALPDALDLLGPQGRIAVISFHSLEDRIVKTFFREKAKENRLTILTKKPLLPSRGEVESNPRARSAKLRAAEKL